MVVLKKALLQRNSYLAYSGKDTQKETIIILFREVEEAMHHDVSNKMFKKEQTDMLLSLSPYNEHA